jgi:hypothetical protein
MQRRGRYIIQQNHVFVQDSIHGTFFGIFQNIKYRVKKNTIIKIYGNFPAYFPKLRPNTVKQTFTTTRLEIRKLLDYLKVMYILV